MRIYEVDGVQIWEYAGVDNATFMAMPFKTYPKKAVRAMRDAGIMFTTMFAQLLLKFEMTHPVTIVKLPRDRDSGTRYGCKLQLDQYKVAATARMAFDKEANTVTFYGDIELFCPPVIDDFEGYSWGDRFLSPEALEAEAQARFDSMPD